MAASSNSRKSGLQLIQVLSAKPCLVMAKRKTPKVQALRETQILIPGFESPLDSRR